MKHFAILCALLGAAFAGQQAPSLAGRQADGAVSESLFMRRAYHSSVVMDLRVYIDGGLFSESTSEGVQYNYSNTLLYIDISKDFTPDSANVSSIQKPDGAPDVIWGGIWAHDGVLYTGFAGHYPLAGDKAWQDSGLWSFEPDTTGESGKWTNMNGTAAYFAQGSRPFLGCSASGNGTGWFLGGQKGSGGDNETHVPTSGLLSYDFATGNVTNTTVTGTSMGGWDAYGQMHYVPNFGPAGVVVSIGGLHDDPDDSYLQGMSKVQVLDPSTGSWYEQGTSGAAPQARKEYCLAGAASSNETYELVVYAGWNGTLGTGAIPWDDLYVLSLPSFRWFKASYDALHPRHGLTCEHIGGGQVLMIGGVDTTFVGVDDQFLIPFNSEDTHDQGLTVFDLNSMSFTDSFQSNKTAYDQASAVRTYYATHDRMANFTSSGLRQVFSVQNFTAVKPSAGGGTSATYGSSGSGGSSSSTSAGAIAGGVVGGVAGAAIIGAAVFCLLRRRRRRRDEGNVDTKTAAIESPTSPRSELGAYPSLASKSAYEMPDPRLHYHIPEMPGEKFVPVRNRGEMPGDDPAVEADSYIHRAELP